LEAQAQHHGRRAEELAAQVRQLEARLRTAGAGEVGGGAEDTQRVQALEVRLAETETQAQRMRSLLEKAARELDEARAEVGRKLNELKQGREGLEFVRRQLAQARAEADQLKVRLAQSGDAAVLRAALAEREQELAGARAERATLDGERTRLRALIQDSEQRQVLGERRITELEMALSERSRRIELLTRELQEKTERLRRLSGLSE
ncbi:MAG: hypothetical protein KC933_40595, partial [Myxococcales bacterium]|nr:hypothetical protein [Myxococcales bacterium]